MVSTQQNRGASDITFTPTTTPTPWSMLLLLLSRKRKKKTFNRRRRVQYVCIHFDGCRLIFNTHTILLTKSISSLSKFKSDNYKTSDILVRIKKENTNSICTVCFDNYDCFC